MIEILKEFYAGKAKPASGGGGGSIDYSRVIEKSSSIPTASAEYNNRMYIYGGETNETYTHGYIYECIAGSVSYEANIVFPKSTFASEDFYKAGELIVDAGVADATQVTNGSMTYAQAGNLWSIVFKDSNGNALNTAYNIYTDDLEQDYDIIPVIDPSEFADEQVIDFTVANVIEHVGDYYWTRIDVQPTEGGGGSTDYLDLENKPQINDVTLSGNKTASDLGLQDTLVSGTNIKTINNSSILGGGNLSVDALPDQTGQSGKFLTTNGTAASWTALVTASYDPVTQTITLA